MIHRTLSIILFLPLGCMTIYGQTSYKSLTPGKSTRADVERVVGQPLKDVSKTLVEYKSPEGDGKLYVQYRDESPTAIARRIELTCSNKACDAIYEKFRQSVRYVEFDARMTEPLRKAYDQSIPTYPTKVTIYFGAPRFLRLLEHSKSEGEYENKVAFFSPELYENATPKGGCTGSIFGTWETVPGYGRDFNLGRVTIERVGDDGIIGAYKLNNGTLTLRRAWQNDQNFQFGRDSYRGEWKDDTGSGTIEIKVEGFNDFQTAEAKLTRTSGTPGSPGTSKNPKDVGSAIGAIIGAIGPVWRGNCVP